MGQYYMAVNLTKGEYLYPHEYNNGLKLMEHSYVGNKFMNAVGKLLMPGEHWYGDKIVWAGDYMEPNEFMDEPIIDPELVRQLKVKINRNREEHEDKYKVDLYDYAEEYFFNAKDYVPFTETNPKYFVNTDTAEYVCTCDAIKYWGGFRAHPLSILTCYDSHAGGSYYPAKEYHDREYVSMWKGNHIKAFSDKAEMIAECGDNLEHLVPEFFEMLPDDKQNKTALKKVPWLYDFLELKSEQSDKAPTEILKNVFNEYNFCDKDNELEL